MEINEIITQLKDKYGDKIDVAHIKEKLKGVDTSKLNFAEITEKVKGGLGNIKHAGAGMVGDLDGDGKEEGVLEEIAGKASSMFNNVFHRN